MDELNFVSYDRPARAYVERDREAVVLRIGRKRLAFPVQAVPALLKMIAEAALPSQEMAVLRGSHSVPARPQP